MEKEKKKVSIEEIEKIRRICEKLMELLDGEKSEVFLCLNQGRFDSFELGITRTLDYNDDFIESEENEVGGMYYSSKQEIITWKTKRKINKVVS